jgi:hypothetical protein
MMTDTTIPGPHSSSQSLNPPGLSRQDSRGSASGAAVDSRFSCNICLDPVVEPVVTQCGHLYCWPCLYRWLEPGMYPDERASLGLTARMAGNNIHEFASMVDTTRRVCPVCKSACSLQSLVPIYVRSASDVSPVRESTSSQEQQEQERAARGSRTSGGISDSVQPPQGTDEISDESRHDDDEEQQDTASSRGGPCHEVGHHHAIHGEEEPIGISSSTGLRQRLRFRSQDSEIPSNTFEEEQPPDVVPNRPSATTPPQPSSPSNHLGNTINNGLQYTSRNNNWITPLSPSGHGGSLAHGILLSFQQAAYSANSGNNTNTDTTANGSTEASIPSLHYSRQRDANGYSIDQQYGQQPPPGSHIDVDSETTQYLSRLLIMLTSFVILCLLLL